jgi:putative ABC transport system ATP-binding protein
MDAVTVAYDGVPRLHEVTFQVEGGQMLAITGPAGAGKTTLLWALAGHLPLVQGQVRCDPLPESLPTGRPTVVLMAQGNALASMLTAVENVTVPLLANGIAPSEARDRALAVLHAVGLESAAGQLVEELSGGQQQRVCVARGLAAGGGVLLADEPTSAVDAANRAVIMSLLRAEAARGAVVLVATHDDETADECDGELRLVDGRVSWARPLPRLRPLSPPLSPPL